MPLRSIAWEDFRRLDAAAKAPYFNQDGGLFHVIVAQQFDRARLEALGALATRIRFIAKTEAGMRFLHGRLDTRRAMLYFTQPSTRTFLSFCAACQILGMTIGEVRDPATSSEYKGESPEDSVRTFSSYFDLIIMRSRTAGLAERMAWVLSNAGRPIPIINAGSGHDQHPTQALLDIYTLQRSFENQGGIDGKCIVFVGDLLRGRTVRSLAALLTNYRDMRLRFIAPEPLQISPDVCEMLAANGVAFEIAGDMEAAIRDADAVYMTRIQDEWDARAGDSARIDTSRFCLEARHLKLIKPSAVIMHPLPRRKEIAVEIDGDPRAVYWRQMRNGMWIRAAIIAAMFGRDGDIREYDG